MSDEQTVCLAVQRSCKDPVSLLPIPLKLLRLARCTCISLFHKHLCHLTQPCSWPVPPDTKFKMSLMDLEHLLGSALYLKFSMSKMEPVIFAHHMLLLLRFFYILSEWIPSLRGPSQKSQHYFEFLPFLYFPHSANYQAPSALSPKWSSNPPILHLYHSSQPRPEAPPSGSLQWPPKCFLLSPVLPLVLLNSLYIRVTHKMEIHTLNCSVSTYCKI